MARVIKGWSLPTNGFKFQHNPPDGCGDMGVGVGGSGGGVLSRGGCGLFGWAGNSCVCRNVL